MQPLARQHGGRCRRPNILVKPKLRWQCAEAHEWDATPAGIKSCGMWCPACGFESLRLKTEDTHAVARARRGKCLSECYVNSETRLPDIWGWSRVGREDNAYPAQPGEPGNIC